MKKIIDGKLCNTETAQKLAEYSSSHSTESLYLTRAGIYFIHRHYNMGSIVKTTYSGFSKLYDDEIIALKRKDAMKWAEAKLSTDEYCELFEVQQEDNADSTTLVMMVPVSLKERIRIASQNAGTSMTAFVIEAIEKHLA